MNAIPCIIWLRSGILLNQNHKHLKFRLPHNSLDLFDGTSCMHRNICSLLSLLRTNEKHMFVLFSYSSGRWCFACCSVDFRLVISWWGDFFAFVLGWNDFSYHQKVTWFKWKTGTPSTCALRVKAPTYVSHKFSLGFKWTNNTVHTQDVPSLWHLRDQGF